MEVIRKNETIEWVDVDEELPEYETRAGSSSFIFVLVDHEKDGVSETMYCDGMFYEPLLVAHPEILAEVDNDTKTKYHNGVKYWAYKPKGISNK